MSANVEKALGRLRKVSETVLSDRANGKLPKKSVIVKQLDNALCIAGRRPWPAGAQSMVDADSGSSRAPGGVSGVARTPDRYVETRQDRPGRIKVCVSHWEAKWTECFGGRVSEMTVKIARSTN